MNHKAQENDAENHYFNDVIFEDPSVEDRWSCPSCSYDNCSSSRICAVCGNKTSTLLQNKFSDVSLPGVKDPPSINRSFDNMMKGSSRSFPFPEEKNPPNGIESPSRVKVMNREASGLSPVLEFGNGGNSAKNSNKFSSSNNMMRSSSLPEKKDSPNVIKSLSRDKETNRGAGAASGFSPLSEFEGGGDSMNNTNKDSRSMLPKIDRPKLMMLRNDANEISRLTFSSRGSCHNRSYDSNLPSSSEIDEFFVLEADVWKCDKCSVDLKIFESRCPICNRESISPAKNKKEPLKPLSNAELVEKMRARMAEDEKVEEVRKNEEKVRVRLANSRVIKNHPDEAHSKGVLSRTPHARGISTVKNKPHRTRSTAIGPESFDLAHVNRVQVINGERRNSAAEPSTKTCCAIM